MGFGSFSSPASSPIIKGKLFSRLASSVNPPPSSPVSTNSSAASSPTSLVSPNCSLTSLPGSLHGHGQGGSSKHKAPTVLKLAAASQMLSLTKSVTSEQQQKESFSSTSSKRQQQQVEPGDSSPRDQNGTATPSGRNSRSPTSLLPPSSAMDTIFEEDGLQSGLSKSSFGNHFDGGNDTSHLSERSGTFAPRSSAQSENGNNALNGGADNGDKIVDDGTNFEESVTHHFNHLYSSVEEERDSISPLQSPVRALPCRRSRRQAILSIDAVEDLAAETDKIQSAQSPQGDHLRRQILSNSGILFRASSPLSYSRSKTLPTSQSIHSLRSRELAPGEMTRSGNRPLSKTASFPRLDCISEGEANSEETEWFKDREPVVKLSRSKESLSGVNEDKGIGLRKRPKTQNKFPIHIQKMLTEHVIGM